MSARLPGSYGVDAPYVPVLSAIGAVVFIGLAVAGSAPGVSLLMALVLIGQAGCYLHATLRGKFVIWRRIIDQMELKGDEQLLDVGCGRGMVMLTAATALPDGVVVGLDLWRGQDQTGNGADAVMANAEAVGVVEQVELHTGDMTEMPFVDGEFDVVVANVAIQNIKNRERRRTAIDEMVRVTADGGRIAVVDIQYVDQYKDDLAAAGAEDVVVHKLGADGWYGNPFYASRLVTATKPG